MTKGRKNTQKVRSNLRERDWQVVATELDSECPNTDTLVTVLPPQIGLREPLRPSTSISISCDMYFNLHKLNKYLSLFFG
jgi:hypothetical protein